MRRNAIRPLAALFSAALLLGACGGGSDDAGDGPANTVAPADDGSQTVGSCSGTTVTGTLPDVEFTATEAAGVSIGDGQGYTVYFADFELSEDLGWSTPDVEAGGTLFTLAVTVFNATEDVEPVAAGDAIEYVDDFGERTFIVSAATDSDKFISVANPSGTLDVTAVGDRFCGAFTYTDDEKSLEGTFEAPIEGL